MNDVSVQYHGRLIRFGCPLGGCLPTCVGGWPGTKVSGEALVKAASRGKLIPERLGCQAMQEQARIALELFGPKE